MSPSDTRSGSRGSAGGSAPAGSVGGSRKSASKAGSASGEQRSPFGMTEGFDPARDPMRAQDIIGKRVDLPPEAYQTGDVRTHFAGRPKGQSKLGRPVDLQLNQFKILSVNPQDIFQFDVSISPIPTRASFTNTVWNTQAVQRELKKFPKRWLYDGRALAWSLNKVPKGGIRVRIDMDAERGRAPRPGRDNFVYLSVTQTSVIRMDALRAYLEGKMEWDTHVLECMNFLDHLLRQYPSEHLLSIRRSFYSEQARHAPLNNLVDVVKGIYASIRLSANINSGGSGLGVNVDVSNTAFWGFNYRKVRGDKFLFEFLRVFDQKARQSWTNQDIVQKLKPIEWRPDVSRPQAGRATEPWQASELFKELRRAHKLRFSVFHRGKKDNPPEYTIFRFPFDVKYGPGGGNALNVKFMGRDGKEISVAEHFAKTYNSKLVHPDLPVIETRSAGYFPLEVVFMSRWQRYNFKLDGDQTSEMIKFAVTRPPQRQKDIMDNVRELRWDSDPYMQEFGIRIDSEMCKTRGRVIPNPEVAYANGKVNPRDSGRWDLRGKKFISTNVEPLEAWAFVSIDRAVDKAVLEAFVQNFTRIYQGHGGNIQKKPQLLAFDKLNGAQVVERCYKALSKDFNRPPQIIFFIQDDKHIVKYERLKRSCECRYGILSQCLFAFHVKKNQAQYCSNVSMKVNAKLGGQTSRIPGVGLAPAFFQKPTMIMGCDVAHVPAGLAGASIAAITFSMDKDAAKYHAEVESNGYRAEIVLQPQIMSMVPHVVRRWIALNKVAPQHVFYLRDGVSEGEFQQVLDEEVRNIREVFREVCRSTPKFTVIVATKRHHIRFFPRQGQSDRNGNPHPGTVVEQEVTHPFLYDFYLCSHSAIQGTARPVHYHVLRDEIGLTPDELQKMIYQHSYQYARSTTPVSLHPAVYYAHLACARARAHEDKSFSEHRYVPGKRNPLFKEADLYEMQRKGPKEASQPLLPIGSKTDADERTKMFTRNTMWYV